jgi:hypothetical protein
VDNYCANQFWGKKRQILVFPFQMPKDPQLFLKDVFLVFPDAEGVLENSIVL